MTKGVRFALNLSLIALGGIIFLSSCRNTGSDYVERLPDLPADVVATLDPATMATKVAAPIPPPEKASGTALAPCCAIHDQKTLQVNFRYTKCGPLHDFIVAPLGDVALLRAKPDTTNVYKLKEFAGKRLLDTLVCVTSDGPWNASLLEVRSCQNYTPRHTLVINAYGDLVQFIWNGPVQNHPPQVQLVSCRSVGTTRFSCGGLSTCDCPSDTCPASQPCACNLQW